MINNKEIRKTISRPVKVNRGLAVLFSFFASANSVASFVGAFWSITEMRSDAFGSSAPQKRPIKRQRNGAKRRRRRRRRRTKKQQHPNRPIGDAGVRRRPAAALLLSADWPIKSNQKRLGQARGWRPSRENSTSRRRDVTGVEAVNDRASPWQPTARRPTKSPKNSVFSFEKKSFPPEKPKIINEWNPPTRQQTKDDRHSSKKNASQRRKATEKGAWPQENTQKIGGFPSLIIDYQRCLSIDTWDPTRSSDPSVFSAFIFFWNQWDVSLTIDNQRRISIQVSIYSIDT